MAISPLARNIKRIIEERGTSARAASLAAGLNETFVRDVVDGASPSIDKLMSLAGALGARLVDLVDGTDGPGEVELLGYAGARDVVNVPEGDAGKMGDMPAPYITGEGWQCVIVRGRSMIPVYWPQEVLFFRKRNHDLVDLYGRDCIVHTERDRRYLKVVRRGREPGLVDLESYAPDVDALRDVTLQWAAPIEVVQRGRR